MSGQEGTDRGAEGWQRMIKATVDSFAVAKPTTKHQEYTSVIPALPQGDGRLRLGNQGSGNAEQHKRESLPPGGDRQDFINCPLKSTLTVSTGTHAQLVLRSDWKRQLEELTWQLTKRYKSSLMCLYPTA